LIFLRSQRQPALRAIPPQPPSDEAAVSGDSDEVDIAQGAVDQARQFHVDIPNLHFI